LSFIRKYFNKIPDKLITKESGFYRRLLQLSIPLSFTSLIGFGAGLADTLMLGTLSEVHLSASVLGNQLGFVYMLFIGGVGGGASILVAQYWGRTDVISIHKVLVIMYRALIAGGVLFTCVALFFGDRIMGIFSTDPRVVYEGAKLLRITGFSFILMGVSSASLSVLRSVGSVNIALYVSIISLSLKAILNWILIFGNLGAPKMEIEGAAIATVVSRFVEFAVVVFYMVFTDNKIRFKLKYLFMSKLDLLRDYIRFGGPVFINEFLWGIGAAIITVVVGRMGTEFTAASAIATTLGHFVILINFSMAFAASTIIGNTVGAGDYLKARMYGNTLTIISIVTGLFSFCLMHLLKYPTLSLYNVSEMTLIFSKQFIDIFAVLVIFQSAVMMMIVGVQRSGGDTRFALIIDVLFMWIISIPLGFLGGLQWGWAAPLVFFVLRGDEIIKTVFCLLRMKSGKWVKDITKDN